jgi:protein TonB
MAQRATLPGARVGAGSSSASSADGNPTPPPLIRVGSNVSAANLTSQVAPVYPPLAKAARVQGTVRFDATIGKDGHVENLVLVSGPPLLVQAAMESARQSVYRPTLLNGQAVSVITTVDVNFTLSQ